MARVFLVRHATHDLVGKVLAGRMADVPLSREGAEQAEALAARFADTEIGRLLSSPLERCRQTAVPIAARLGRDVVVEEALNEIDCGAWTGQSFEALHDDPRWHAWNTERAGATIPGGESMAAVAARAMALLGGLAQDGPPVLLVTHGDVVKPVVLSLLGASLDHHDRLAVDPASVTTLDLWSGGGKIVQANGRGPA